MLSEGIIQNQEQQINNLITYVNVQDSIIELKDSTIDNYSSVVVFKDVQLAEQDVKIEVLAKKNKWMKTGWITTSLLSIILIVYLAI